MMEYSKCQLEGDEEDYNDDDDDDDDDDCNNEQEEEFEDEPSKQQRRRPCGGHDGESYSDEKPTHQAAATKHMAPPLNFNDGDDPEGTAEKDAVSLLGSCDVAAGFNNNSNNDTEITLREMVTAVRRGKTCCRIYFWVVILLSLLVAAIFVAPPPPKSPPTTVADNGGSGSDSHYQSPASSAAQEQEQQQQQQQQQPQQQQQLQCELEITAGTSWDVFVQNVSSPSYDGNRCEQSDRTCGCQNPTVPDIPHEPPSHTEWWKVKFQQNLDRIAQWETSSSSSSSSSAQSNSNNDNTNNNNLDVVFLGDSITEHWVGNDEAWSGNARVFQSLFGNASVPMRSSTTNLMGMPLGVSGDRIPNLLYRLQNGELLSSASSLHQETSIFWILIGTNDVGGDKCLASQVIAGTIAIVKYIQQERPNAKIVLNSILPRGKASHLAALEAWRTVFQPINQGLECFVQGFQKDDDNHGKLYFFNATDLFLTSDRQSINYTLFFDSVHPGEEGSWVWGRAMTKKIQDILTPSR